jgi:hypothetical protein
MKKPPENFKTIIVWVSVFLFSCSSREHHHPTLPPTTEGPAAERLPQSGEFTEMWPGLMSRLISEKLVDREALVDPQIGLYLFDNPGASIIVRKLSGMAEAPENLPSLKGCVLSEAEKVPTYDCNLDRWSAEGCLHVSRPAVALVKTHEFQIIHMESRALTAEDRRRLEALGQLEAQITDAVFHDGTVYYFGRIDGVWRLIAIDAVVPCSA